jgi:hypothetical protein
MTAFDGRESGTGSVLDFESGNKKGSNHCSSTSNMFEAFFECLRIEG